MLGRVGECWQECAGENATQRPATHPNGTGREEGARIVGGNHAKSGGNGAENNDDERTGTRAFVAALVSVVPASVVPMPTSAMPTSVMPMSRRPTRFLRQSRRGGE